MRILVISDLHLCEYGQTVDGQDTNEAFERGWSMLQTPLAAADFLVIAGDIAQQGSVKTYRRLQKLTSYLGRKLLLTVGNKDDRGRLIQVFGFEHRCDTGHIQTARHGTDASVIVLDSLLPGSSEGQLCGLRLGWLEKQLAIAGGSPVVVVLHHPVAVIEVPSLDEVALQQGRDDLLNLLRNYSGHCMIVSGHHHIQIVGSYQGVRYCIAPAFSGPPAKFGIWGQAPVFGRGPNGAMALTMHADRETNVQYLLF